MPSHRHILIIDDNPSIHADFRKILCPQTTSTEAISKLEATLFGEAQPAAAALSFELDSAYQGEAGLAMVKQALAEQRPYALAFVDVRMPPGWDGVETIAHIWKVDPQIQIVVCTAYADYSWEELRAKVGQPDSLVVLKKPFDNVEVQQLAHALSKKWLLNQQAEMKLAELEIRVQQRTEELARANQSLTATEERFSKAFHASPVPSGIHSLADGRFVDVNARLVALTGYAREELLQRSPADLLSDGCNSNGANWSERLARHEEVTEVAAQLRGCSGRDRETLVSLVPVLLSGRPHALFLAQDITDRLMLERQFQQAQKLEAIGRLAGGVAHDFNNLLGVITMNADVLEQVGPLVEEQAEMLAEIRKASDRAANLTRQLLLYSRRQSLQPREFDLNEAIGQTTRMLERIVGEDVEIQVQQCPDPLWLRADPTTLDQVLMNLAVNSRDAMPAGGQLRIETAAQEFNADSAGQHPGARAGSFVRLSVRDTGCGIPAELLPKIFDPFFTTKDVGKGTGLGLATVFSVVQQHQGWINVDSQVGSGTTFRIYLPRLAQPRATAASDTRLLSLRGGQETILLVEDEPAFRSVVRLMLTRLGYQVFEAVSGAEAMEVWQEHRAEVSLLLTDLVMPDGLSGKDLAERLQADKPGLPVVYTSGYSADVVSPDFHLRKGENFLAKPFSAAALAKVIRARLD